MSAVSHPSPKSQSSAAAGDRLGSWRETAGYLVLNPQWRCRWTERPATQRNCEVAHGWEWLRARDRLAELYREVGRQADAERIDREPSALLVVADEDHGIKRRVAAAGHRAR